MAQKIETELRLGFVEAMSVESVASAMQASGLRGVSVLGIGGLANVGFSSDVVEIVVLGENDDASRKAIDKAAPSLVGKGIRVRVAQPPQGFGDFNDLIDPSKEGGGPGGLVIAKMIIEAAPEWRPKRPKGANPPAPKQASQASFIVDLAASRCNLFWDPTGAGSRQNFKQARLVNRKPGRCLDVASGAAAERTWLQISDCGDSAGQVCGSP